MKTYFVGKTEFNENGTIKAFHVPVKKFKRDIEIHEEGFDLSVKIGNRDHIHDFKPRSFAGVNLFDKYHGRQSVHVVDLIVEAKALLESAKTEE